jgi:DNA-binding NarL/FixJ family response regulator
MASIVLLHTDLPTAHRLGETIAGVSGLEVVDVIGTMADAHALLANDVPDLLVVDLCFPTDKLRSLMRSLRGAGSFGRPQVLALAPSVDDPRLIDVLRHGADGYVLQSRGPESLLVAIAQTLSGEAAMAPQVARQVQAIFDAAAFPNSGFGERGPDALLLSEVDRTLLKWIAEGYLVAEVARGLELSPRTVGARIHAIYRRLQLDLRTPHGTLQAA